MSGSIWQTRWSREQLQAMLAEQMEAFLRQDTGVERERLADLQAMSRAPHAVVISGLRRVGKSTLLVQLARQLPADSFYYVNFEDERFLGFQADDANALYALLLETYGKRPTFLVDEIQNVAGWERFVRRLTDQGHKFYITGSNASLLSRDLGTRLTGRYLPVELFPFSFAEFLRFVGYEQPGRPSTTSDAAQLRQHLWSYVRRGGVPEALKYPDLPLHRRLFDDVLYRDIAARYRIGEVAALRDLAFYLMSNPASLVSYNKLKAMLQLGSVTTIKSYVEHLQDSWLLFTANVYDYSVKRQQIAPKKAYGIDTGLMRSVGMSATADSGKLLENVVYLALRQRTHDVYYYADAAGHEVDFCLPRERELIQVCQDMHRPETRERELRALRRAMEALGFDHGLILTETGEERLAAEEGRSVEVRAVAEWLLAP